MSRAERWQQSSAGTTQLSAKVPEPLKQDFREACDQRGETMTAVIEEKMAEAVDEELGAGSADPLPDEPELANAYRSLRRSANPDNGRLKTDQAESIAAQSARVNSDFVRSTVLKPLANRGYIQPMWGSVKVLPPEEVGSRA